MIRDISQHDCEYTLLDGNIHHFVFRENTDQAIDVFFDTLETLLRQGTGKALVLYLDITHYSTKLPSLNYVRTRMKRMVALYPNRPPARAAIVHNYGMVVSSLQTFIKIVPIKSATRYNFISANQADKAFDWLLETSS